MPCLIYDEQPRRGGSKAFKIEEFDSVSQFLVHYSNSLELSFFLANGNREEKQQASKELAIADRKMTFWRRAPNFDMEKAQAGIKVLKQRWSK